ncbi:MAG: RNA polymerase sigma factor [Candidatus Peregrinibacteria bacterium]|nr:RNA polymerase sigma factor [Candidatus Peregrinibacteria bacterium]
MPNFEEFNKYYEEHMPQVYGYVYMRTNRDKSLAEDIVSEIFLKAIENFEQYSKEKGTFKSWIFQITKNYLIDYFRSNKNKASSSIDDLANELRDPSDTKKAAQEEIEKEIIKEAIETLPDNKKELILLRYFSGYSYEEIAEITKDNENNIRVVIHRTLQDLKRKLEPIKYQSE